MQPPSKSGIRVSPTGSDRMMEGGTGEKDEEESEGEKVRRGNKLLTVMP